MPAGQFVLGPRRADNQVHGRAPFPGEPRSPSRKSRSFRLSLTTESFGVDPTLETRETDSVLLPPLVLHPHDNRFHVCNRLDRIESPSPPGSHLPTPWISSTCDSMSRVVIPPASIDRIGSSKLVKQRSCCRCIRGSNPEVNLAALRFPLHRSPPVPSPARSIAAVGLRGISPYRSASVFFGGWQ